MDPKERWIPSMRRIAATKRLLRIESHKFPGPLASEWEYDLGRSLVDYKRVHYFMLEHFGSRGMNKISVTHLAAGNGLYMHFLRHRYGVDTTAVEINPEYVRASTEHGLTPNFTVCGAEDTGIKGKSQDVVLSDHFLFSGFGGLKTEKIIEEARRVLKPNGIFLMERCNPIPEDAIRQMGFIRIKRSYLGFEHSYPGAFYVLIKTKTNDPDIFRQTLFQLENMPPIDARAKPQIFIS